jgi:acyl-CoA synthetase (NDP forming)
MGESVNLDPLFRPSTVAVIGASDKELSIGYRILHNLSTYRFRGTLFPINPKVDSILDYKAYPTIMDVPAEVDLAHIVLRNTLVPDIVEQCGKKGVKVVIVNSAGFKEIGAEGTALEDEVVRIAREYGTRVFGPNCQGVMNSDEAVGLYANFTFTPLRPGHISLIAQSGGVGEVINNRLYELDAGVRLYASNGNACDISIPEILGYMGRDDGTRVIIVHIESLSDPRGFLEAAREVSRSKPVLAMKSGRTEEGAKAVCSHTGMLLQQETTARMIFKKAGVQYFSSHEDICQTAVGFACQPVPEGRGVGIITNTGGPAIIATDELIEAGLEIPSLSNKAKAALEQELHPAASVSNPIDVLATGTPQHFAAGLRALLSEDDIHSILLHFVTPFFVDCPAVAGEIAAVGRAAEKTIASVAMTNKEIWAETLRIVRESGIPTYDFPETAARVLARMTEYGEFRTAARDEHPEERFEVDVEKAKRLLDKKNRGPLPAEDVFSLLECYGIRTVVWKSAHGAKEAIQAAEEIGFPVVLKIDSPEVIHKSDAGGVVLDIRDSKSLRLELERMQDQFAAEDQLYLVQSFWPGGIEVIAGAKAEAGLGHAIMFGLGGIYVEVLKDVAFSLAPLSRREADKLVRAVRAFPLLLGARGKEGADIYSLREMLLRLSQFVSDFPRISEVDLNPISAGNTREATAVLDARIIL